ncbi:PBP1A family penicillin-binding protein [Paenibacillus sp. VCA1]|uniref:PBP1A family penicillin-binding protein n=1 Tax=Paenibacillus sp. VCA1 TaxID=3039148 RepID=UPI00287292CC|nr:PBP1A family penicillin-binding protein [Paenibacillus sp. VCA1]MDR9854057.1 PBP1A family penicillin-binding protein [Paenibacillus sp. VCA1]
MDNNKLSRTGNKNKEQPSKTPKKKKRKLSGKRIFWTLFFTCAIAVFCALAGYLYISVNGERLYQANKDKITLHENSKVYDRNGNVMGELSLQKSDPVNSEDIPKLLKEAFVATEDKRFYEHSGVDLWSIGRAAVKDVIARSKVEGGSTITQQLARNIFLTRDKTFFRKATEVSIALALDRNLTKDEVLTMYLNRINFGGQIYGIKEASKYYFGVSDLKELKLWQMATLAAMPKGPSKYNPLRNPDLSMQRRAVVLNLMAEQGYITAEEAEQAKKVVYDYEPPKKKQNYQNFMDYVMNEAEDVTGLSEDDLNIGGYKIYTTMDANAQKVLEKEFADASNFEKSKDDKQVQGSMVIMNQENGALVALLGGRDYERKGYSRVTNSRRQPGSAFKPIVSYAPALESGKFNINTPLSNEKQCFGKYCPTNLHGYSSTISMEEAITKSENIPAVWLLNQIGVKAGYDFATKLGIQLTDEDKNLAMALGGISKGTNTLEMAQAYSTFANGGTFYKAFSIKKIVDSDGKVVFEHKDSGKKVMEESTAYQMTRMMENVVDSGTGKKARINRPVAGKTGTTQSGIKGNKSNRDVWFVGYTPELTAAVWMGYDNPDKDHLLHNSSPLAAAFWGKVMKQALENFPAKEFKVPADMKEKEPEPPAQETPQLHVSGLIASYSPDTQTVSLSWNGDDNGNAVYRLYRKAASDGDFTVLQDGIRTTSIDDIGTVAGESYQYYVVAVSPDTGQESDPSNTVTVTIQPQQDEQLPPPDENMGDHGQNGDDMTGQDPNQNGGFDNGQGTGNPGNGSTDGNGNQSNNGNSNGNGNGKGNGHGNGNGNGNAHQGGDPGAGSGIGDTGTTVPPDNGGSTDPGSTDGTQRVDNFSTGTVEGETTNP